MSDEHLDLKEILHKKEDLHPDLAAGLVSDEYAEMTGTLQGIYTKFYHQPLVPPQMYAFANKVHAFKTAQAEKAFDEQNWHKFIILHEKPYRAEAFYECTAQIISDETYWSLAIDVFLESENVWQNQQLWSDIFNHTQRKKALALLPHLNNLSALHKRTDTHGYLTVYRGCKVDIGNNGISWTLDYDRAHWFAHRFTNEDPLIIEGKVHLQDVLFFSNARGEQEVVICEPERAVLDRLMHCA